MKQIWVFCQYNNPPELGYQNRHYNFGKYLREYQFESIVFVGSNLHNSKTQINESHSVYKIIKNHESFFVFIKTCVYQGSRIKQIISMFQYYFRVLKITTEFPKPDVIIGSSPHPLAALAAIKLSKKYRVPCIIEIRDLWPASFVAYKIINKHNPLMRLLYLGEKWIYSQANKIIFTMEGGKDYIINKGWDKDHGGSIDLGKIYHINNGVDLETFNSERDINILKDPDLNDKNTFKVLYTGAIRHANNIITIVETAKYIKESGYGNIRFLLYGSGTEEAELQKYCIDNSIDNLLFKGKIDKKQIPYVLSQSNLNLLNYMPTECLRYGGSQNKLFEYFASGKPILSTVKTGYDLIERYNCGVSIDTCDPPKIAQEIIKFSQMAKTEYEMYCNNALRAARAYDFKILTKKLVEVIEGEQVFS